MPFPGYEAPQLFSFFLNLRDPSPFGDSRMSLSLPLVPPHPALQPPPDSHLFQLPLHVPDKLSFTNWPEWQHRVKCFLALAGYPPDVLDRPPEPTVHSAREADKKLGAALALRIEYPKLVSLGFGIEVPGAYELWKAASRAHADDLETRMQAGFFTRYNSFVFEKGSFAEDLCEYLKLVAELKQDPSFRPLAEEPIVTRNLLSHVPSRLRAAAEKWQIFNDKYEWTLAQVVSRLERADEEARKEAVGKARSSGTIQRGISGSVNGTAVNGTNGHVQNSNGGLNGAAMRSW